MDDKTATTLIAPVMMKVGDKEYPLIYDFNDMCDVEGIVGANLLAAIEQLTNLNARQVRGLIYAMTRKTLPNMTLAECGALVRLDALVEITNALVETCAMAVSPEFAAKFRGAVTEEEKKPKPEAEEQPVLGIN